MIKFKVIKNIQAACKKVLEDGYHVVSGGTDNHLFLLDMRSKKLDGARIETILNEIDIYINKNTVPGDKSALIPSGIRIGSPAMTTRGCLEKDFVQIMTFLNRGTEIASKISKETKSTKLKDFKDTMKTGKWDAEIEALKK
jgi:glycine hydroxymethyltransferase